MAKLYTTSMAPSGARWHLVHRTTSDLYELETPRQQNPVSTGSTVHLLYPRSMRRWPNPANVWSTNEKGNNMVVTDRNRSIPINRKKTYTSGATMAKINGSSQAGAKVTGKIVGPITGTSHRPTIASTKIGSKWKRRRQQLQAQAPPVEKSNLRQETTKSVYQSQQPQQQLQQQQQQT